MTFITKRFYKLSLRQRTVIIAGLRLEGAEGVDLRHAAPGVVGVTGTVLTRLLGQARVQIHYFSWYTKAQVDFIIG